MYAELLQANTKILGEVARLVAGRQRLEGLGERSGISDTFVEALRTGHACETVQFEIDTTPVVAVLARAGTGRDTAAEIGVWGDVVAVYDQITGRENPPAADEILHRDLPAQIAVMAWTAPTGHRIMVRGSNGDRLAFRAAVAATTRRAGVLVLVGAAAVAGWRLLHRGTRHGAAAMSTVALAAAVASLTVATVKPVTTNARNGPAPTATATVIQPAYPSESPGIARQTGGATSSPEHPRPGATGPSGPVPSPVPPAARDLPALPLLPVPKAPTLPAVPIKPPPVPVPTPLPPPKRRRAKCALGLTLNPLLDLCVLPGN